MDYYSPPNIQPLANELPPVKKKVSFLNNKKMPLFAAGGLMAVLVLGAASMVLTRMNRSTDTRSQASAGKTAQLIIEPSVQGDKQVYTVYFDGTQLPIGTRVVNFATKLRLQKNSTDTQAIPVNVLGDSVEVSDEELVDQLAQTNAIMTCGNIKCPPGQACVSIAGRAPFCAPLVTKSPVPSPQLVSPKPTIQPPRFSPNPTVKPLPSASPIPGLQILGTYENLSVVGYNGIFSLVPPKFVNNTTTQPPYLSLVMSGSVKTTTATWNKNDPAFVKKIPLFMIQAPLSDPTAQYAISIESQSIKGYLPGITAIVELTGKQISNPTPAPSPFVSPVPVGSPIPPTTSKCPSKLVSANFLTPCNGGYQSVNFICTDGYNGNMGGSTSCKSQSTWSEYATQECAKRLTSFCPALPPTVTPQPSVQPTAVPSPILKATPWPSPVTRPTPWPSPYVYPKQ